MRYEDGTETLEPGAEVRVRVTGNKLICRARRQEAGFSIPVEQITEIVYDDESWRASRDVKRNLAAAIAEDPRTVLAVPIVAITVLPVAHAWKRKRHYVEILWEENGEGRRAAFLIGKGDYQSFLAELEEVAGLERRDLVEERQALRDRLREQVRRHVEACNGRPIPCPETR